MTWIQSLLKSFTKLTENSDPYRKGLALRTMPTVKFNSSLVTEKIKTDLRNNIKLIDGLDKKYFEQVYKAAVRAISAGGNLHGLFTVLMGLDGMSKKRATDIAHSLNSKAGSLISRERSHALGFTHAVWMYLCKQPVRGATCLHQCNDIFRFLIHFK